MSSEAAQKAYEEIQWMTMTELLRNAFDRGAVEALRQAAAQIRGSGMHSERWDGIRVEYTLFETSPDDRTPATILRRMADEWGVEQ